MRVAGLILVGAGVVGCGQSGQLGSKESKK